jgi:hypothetical protein
MLNGVCLPQGRHVEHNSVQTLPDGVEPVMYATAHMFCTHLCTYLHTSSAQHLCILAIACLDGHNLPMLTIPYNAKP